MNELLNEAASAAEALFEVARQKEIISRQRDIVRKALLTFSVVSEICFWLCVESVIRPSSFHSSYYIMMQKVYTKFLRASVHLCLKWKYSLKCKCYFWKQKELYIYYEVIYIAEHINTLKTEEKMKIGLLLDAPRLAKELRFWVKVPIFARVHPVVVDFGMSNSGLILTKMNWRTRRATYSSVTKSITN